MIARLVQVTTKPGRLQEFVKAMAERNLPILKQQPGFVDAVVLASDTQCDELVGIAFWKTKEDAERYAKGQGRQVLEAMTPLLQKMPTIRTFILAASTAYDIDVGNAVSWS
jgi:heme-degrading monooxygenase HmoA